MPTSLEAFEPVSNDALLQSSMGRRIVSLVSFYESRDGNEISYLERRATTRLRPRHDDIEQCDPWFETSPRLAAAYGES